MKKPLISVIIPVYKVEKYLDKCVASVVSQTYENLEIILVDDGSPDNCPAMCDEWAKKDNRIKVIHKENGGLSDARNRGIEIATGEYIMFVDSDDYLDETMCDKLYALISQHNATIAISNFKRVWEEATGETETTKIETVVLDRDQIIDQIYNPTIISIVPAWAKLYKKSLFAEIRYPVGRLHEDEYVIHELLFGSEKIVYTSEQLYFYLQRASSITGSKKEKNIIDSMDAFRARMNFMDQKFPNRQNDNRLLLLKNIRYVYCCNGWMSKSLKKQVFLEFSQLYKSTAGQGIKNRLFRYFPNTVSFILSIKRRIFNEK